MLKTKPSGKPLVKSKWISLGLKCFSAIYQIVRPLLKSVLEKYSRRCLINRCRQSLSLSLFFFFFATGKQKMCTTSMWLNILYAWQTSTLLISMKKINVDRHRRTSTVQMFIAFINFHPLKCLSSRGSPERSTLISQICFAPGVDQAEGTAFSPSEQTRNASFGTNDMGGLTINPICFLGDKTQTLKTAVVLDTP